ncbi:MAG: DNA-binding response regulator [Caldilinea sp. CFX5]|nr:DNA-binding response regulator [Caldilinea sp. CFX5]
MPVLVVDDNENLLRMLQRTLAYEGFAVTTAGNGREALRAVENNHPKLIILDWLMPEVDGLTVVKRLRARCDATPILMLTARDAIENRVEGLNHGADDYLVKPFAPEELLARMNALLRRTEGSTPNAVLAYAGLRLNPVTRETQRDDRRFELTPTEFDLLHLFLRHPRQVLTRQKILEEVWGYDFNGEDNVLEVYIGYLRKKTEADQEPRLIQTARGVGYVLREE